MNDEETVALIAGGHTFGKTHGAADPDEYVGREPEGAPIEADGPRLEATRSAPARARTRSPAGLEVTWTATPTQWGNGFFDNLFGYEWELTKSPAGAHQWQPKDGAGAGAVPGPAEDSERASPDDAHDRPRAARSTRSTRRSRAASTSTRRSSPTRSRAPGSSSPTATWGRSQRYLGPEVPSETLIWQDPVPAVDHG